MVVRTKIIAYLSITAAALSSLCHTFLRWVHGANRAEGPLPSVIVRPHFHVKRWEGWDGVVAEDVACHARCGDNCSRPCDHAHRPEDDDVAKALSVLQFLRNRLGAKHKTIVILKRIQTKKQTGLSLRCTLTRASVIRHSFFFCCYCSEHSTVTFCLIFLSCMAM